MQNRYTIYYVNNKLDLFRTAKSVTKYYARNLFDKYEQACVGKKAQGV